VKHTGDRRSGLARDTFHSWQQSMPAKGLDSQFRKVIDND
jgi:hypothetical protein